ncbi:MAG: efflux RND transporter periplasmic adaptor subunit [Cyanobacteria bacterium J06642_2]
MGDVAQRKRGGVLLAVAAVVTIAAGVVAYRLVGPFQAISETEAGANTSLPVATLPRQVRVGARGRLEPAGGIIQVSGPTGERIGQLVVDEGDWVRKGQAIAYLDSYNERLAERDVAASELEDARKQFEAETALREAEIAEARTRLEQADLPQSFAISAQRATVRELEAELAIEQEDLERFELLVDEGAIAQQTYERQRTVVRQAREKLSNARSSLTSLRADRDTDIQNAEASLTAAEANVERWQAQISPESAERNLELAKARLERTIIRAPIDGRILRTIVETGETIPTNNAAGIVEMGNTNQMYAIAEVYETDVKLVNVGQRASIVSRNGAFEGELSGTVEHVGWQIFKNDVLDDDPAADADARVVEVEIRLDISDIVAGLTNLNVDVAIALDDEG